MSMNAVGAVPAPAQLKRGVAKYRRRILGRNAYLAVTSEQMLLHGAIFLVSDGMTDAELVVWLHTELDKQNPQHGPRLQLVPRTVQSSFDGPSLSHPAIMRLEASLTAERKEDAAARDLDAIDDTGIESLLKTYPEGHIMRGVCLNLSRMLSSETG